MEMNTMNTMKTETSSRRHLARLLIAMGMIGLVVAVILTVLQPYPLVYAQENSVLFKLFTVILFVGVLLPVPTPNRGDGEEEHF